MTDFHLLIIDWYRQNKRDLPWRSTTNPYYIWLSEIILQQTRVEQGTKYYLKFVEEFPEVKDLANASEQKVLNLWQGLGYYSRARNIHFTAKHIQHELNGKFPTTYSEIIKLKGIGPYTAAAISSFAFNEVQAVVDGNVYRVLSRVFDIDLPIDSSQGQKHFQELAQSLIPEKNPGEFNQAIMEFGALHCTPSTPNCEGCVFQHKCAAFANNTVNSRPVKRGKTKVSDRYFYYGIFEEKGKICIQKRIEKDIWQNMYEFPKLESKEPLTPQIVEAHFSQYGLTPSKISSEVKHILSHQRIHAKFYHFDKIPKMLANNAVQFNDLTDHPLPRLIDRYLEKQESR